MSEVTHSMIIPADAISIGFPLHVPVKAELCEESNNLSWLVNDGKAARGCDDTSRNSTKSCLKGSIRIAATVSSAVCRGLEITKVALEHDTRRRTDNDVGV